MASPRVRGCAQASNPQASDIMRPSLAVALVLTVVTLMRADTPMKPTALLNGKDLAAWELVVEPAADIAKVCTYNADGSLAVAGTPLSFLATKTSYENYTLHAEWRWKDKPGNSGILVHIASGPKDRQWPVCLQVQLKNKAVGDLIPMAGATFAEPFTTPPGANPAFRAHDGADAEKPVGEWNSADIACRGDTVEVTINGIRQTRVTKVTPAAGKIGFQLEGLPFEIRNVRIAPLPAAIGSSPQTPPAKGGGGRF
jgi:hypothetical protein